MKLHPLNDKRSWYRNEYLKSEHWQSLKGAKLATQSFCSHCRATQNLDVHHRRYKAVYNVTLSDLEVLCRACHRAEHERIEHLKKRYGQKRPLMRKRIIQGHAKRWAQKGRKFSQQNVEINAIRGKILKLPQAELQQQIEDVKKAFA